MIPLWKLVAFGSGEAIETIERSLADTALAATLYPLDDGRQTLELIFNAPPAPDRLAEFDGVAISCHTLSAQDWLATGAHADTPPPIGRLQLQRGAAPLRTGLRLSLSGVHAFGDGHHATTRGCLAALDWLQQCGVQPRHIADIGCGSGVLAVAAAKLWPSASIMASDLDPAALVETKVTAVQNGMRHIRARLAAGFTGHRGDYNLILMNILAGPLTRLAAMAARQLQPGGYIILSGLLEEQRGLVLQAYRAQRLALLRQSRQDGWMTLILRKRP